MVAIVAVGALTTALLAVRAAGPMELTGAVSTDRERYHHRLRVLMNSRPKDAEVRFQYANHLRAAGMQDEAIVYYRRCLALDPRHRQARYFLALTLADKGYPERAFKLLRELMEETPSDPELYDHASRLLDRMEQPAVAFEYRQRYWALVNPESVRVEVAKEDLADPFGE